jgi:hypothetical protein
MPSVSINPKADFAFQKIFGSKRHNAIVISDRDQLFGYDSLRRGSLILNVEILDPDQAPRIKERVLVELPQFTKELSAFSI